MVAMCRLMKEASEEIKPADKFILKFYPPRLRNRFLLFKPLCVFLWLL
jgi:hypothetical protein